jgi:hypothetical protein
LQARIGQAQALLDSQQIGGFLGGNRGDGRAELAGNE